MVFGCDGEGLGCMAHAGRSLGADKLLYGTLRKAPGLKGSVVVSLKVLDVRTVTVERFVNETVPKQSLASSNVSTAAARWFSALIEVEVRTTLTVTSDPAGAAVAVDGVSLGRTPVTLRDLSLGLHKVAISAEGRITATRSVELKQGGVHEVAVLSITTHLGRSRPRSCARRSRQPRCMRRLLRRRRYMRRSPLRLQPRHRRRRRPQPVSRLRPNPGWSLSRARLTAQSPAPTQHPGRTAKILGLAAVVGAVVAGSVAIYTWRSYSDSESTTHNELVQLRPPTLTPD